jgi:hypothetical protein
MLVSLGVVSPVVQASKPVSTQARPPQEFESLVCNRFTGGAAIKGELRWVEEMLVDLQLGSTSACLLEYVQAPGE